MVKDISRNKRDTLRGHICFFTVNIPYLDIFNIFFLVHCLDIIDTERENVLIVDSINDCIGMKLIAESLCCCAEIRILARTGIQSKDWRACKTEKMILPEFLCNRLMHITELTAVTFIKDDNDTLIIYSMGGILFDECSELLNSGNDNTAIGIFKLFFQNSCRCVAVSGTFFKAVILTHSLIVEILPVNYKQHLVDIIEL